MGTCCKCLEEFEDEWLHKMFISSEGYTEPLCGVCALEITRRIHNNPNMMFTGTQAKKMYNYAKKKKKRRGTWLRKDQNEKE